MSYKIISFTNAGYFDFCQNWYLTIRKAGITNDILVYCLDEKSIDLCNEYNIPCKPWLSESQFGYSPEEFVVQGSKQWGPSRIPFKKLEIINHVLSQGDDILYSDTDVVFLRDPSDEFQTDKMLLIQPEGKQKIMLCSGFFYVKSTPATVNLTQVSESLIKGFTMDQPLLNSRIKYSDPGRYPKVYKGTKQQTYRNGWIEDNTLTWGTLSHKTFPAGGPWLQKKRYINNPYVIHYNCIHGKENKINKMREDKNWYVDVL